MNLRKQHLHVVTLIAAIVAATAAISASAATPLKITNCNRASSRPLRITLTCADANTLLRSLNWSSFGGLTARATGTLVTNTCEPNCAQGRDVSYRVSVTATSPRTCRGGLRVYNRLALQFTRRAPARSNSFKRWTLGCPI